jgi:hypothetical protein
MQDCLFDAYIPENRHLEIVSIKDDAQTAAFLAHIRRAQEIVHKHVPEGISLVDELVAERKKEAACG